MGKAKSPLYRYVVVRRWVWSMASFAARRYTILDQHRIDPSQGLLNSSFDDPKALEIILRVENGSRKVIRLCPVNCFVSKD